MTPADLRSLRMRIAAACSLLDTVNAYVPARRWIARGFLNDARRQLRMITLALEDAEREAWKDGNER